MISLDRTQINYICERIQNVKGIESKSIAESTRCVKVALAQVLASVRLDREIIPEAIQELLSLISRAYNSASLVDGVLIGARASEGLSAGIGQIAQSLFKMVDKIINLDEAANKAVEIFDTKDNRTYQEVTLHLNRDFVKPFPWVGNHFKRDTIDKRRASNRGNFTLYDVSQAQSIFVSYSLSDILKHGDIRKSSVIGVMDFEGDGASESVRKIRRKSIEDYMAPTLEPRIWNRIEALRNNTSPGPIYTLRLFLDPTIMYANSISMETVVTLINTNIRSAGGTVFVIGSDLATGIIDIITPSFLGGGISQEESEGVFFGHVALPILEEMVISGITGVKSSNISKIKLSDLYQIEKPNTYHVGELGRAKILVDYHKWCKENDIEPHQTLYDFDNEMYIKDKPDSSDYLITTLQDKNLVISHSENDSPKPDIEYLDKLYIGAYLGNIPLKNVWMLRLDMTNIINNDVDIDLIVGMLTYCGLRIISLEPHRIIQQRVGYIYVESEDNPREIISIHKNMTRSGIFDENGTNKIFAKNTNGKIESTGYLSDHAFKYLKSLAEEQGNDDPSGSISFDVTNIFQYQWLTLKVSKRSDDYKNKKTDIEKYLMSHVFYKILSHPIVDRYKSISNDWNVMSCLIGVEATKNDYGKNTRVLLTGCGVKSDPKHYGVHNEFTFSKSRAYGVGEHSFLEHNVGPITEATSKRATDRYFAGTNRDPEDVKNFAVAQMIGSVPLVGRNVAERYVAMSEKFTKEARRKKRERETDDSTKKQEIETESAVSKALKILLAEQDPYISIPRIKVNIDGLDLAIPDAPREIDIEYSIDIPEVRNRISKSYLEMYVKISKRASYEYIKKEIIISDGLIFYDPDAITNFVLNM